MRAAIRSLLKARSFSAIAIAIVAIGVGSTTAVFSIVDAVLLKALPFADADRVVVLSGLNTRRGVAGASFSYPAFQELRARVRSFSGVAAVSPERFTITGVEHPEQVPSARVSAAFFDVIGVHAAVGRTFQGSDDRPDARAVVIGSRFRARWFNGAESAVGSTLVLNDEAYIVVGALRSELPPPFAGVDIWATRPDAISSFTPVQIEGGLGYLTAVARLAPGVPAARAQAEVDSIARGYARAHPTNTDADPDATLQLVPVREQASGGVRPTLLMLAAVVAAVLLTACANVANLLLVRATARTHEAAVRAALGASRSDLARWMCTESLILTLIGGAIGAIAAFAMLDLASAYVSALPRGSEVEVNARSLVFALVLSCAAGVAFGLAPLRRTVGRNAVEALRAGGRGLAGSRRGAAGVLVAAEVAVSLVLLVTAGLLVESLARMIYRPVGFRTDRLVTMRLSVPASRYGDAASLRAFMDRLMTTLDRTPGIAAAAAAMVLPPDPSVMAPYQLYDAPQRPIGARPTAVWSAVTPRYFSAIEIPIVAGRTFTAADNESSPLVAIISESLARRAWPSESAIGKRLIVGRQNGYAEVVGVAGDVPNAGLGAPPRPQMYTPYAQRPWPAVGNRPYLSPLAADRSTPDDALCDALRLPWPQ